MSDAAKWIPKVGDMVRAFGRGDSDAKHEGVLVHYDQSDATYLVEFDDGWNQGHDARSGDGRMCRWWFNADDLEPVAAVADERGFRVGDLVVCLDDWEPGEQFTKGVEYEVSRVSPGWVSVVADDAGRSNGLAASQFKLAPSEPLPKFKSGDRVPCTGPLAYDYTNGKWDREDDIELVPAESPVPAAAPALTIEAGKYYLTRDGRTVGPMKKMDGGWAAYPRLDKGEAFDWYDGGGYYLFDDSPYDLVSEYTAPPATPAPFTITGPGEYITRDGQKAIVENWNGESEHCWEGYVVDENTAEWTRDGRFNLRRELEIDIVGPWPGTASTPQPATCVVMAIRDGKYSSAPRPITYPNRVAALEEAAKLASEDPGVEFAVFERIGSRTAVATTTITMKEAS